MAYLIPFYIASPENILLYRTIVLTDEPGIPDDSYQLQEWYCPNPQCDCHNVHLKVVPITERIVALTIHLELDPEQPPAPVLEPDDQNPTYSQKLFKLLADELVQSPSYIQKLRDHYRIVKLAAANPTHPCHKAVIEWAKTGHGPNKSVSQMPKHKKKKK